MREIVNQTAKLKDGEGKLTFSLGIAPLPSHFILVCFETNTMQILSRGVDYQKQE